MERIEEEVVEMVAGSLERLAHGLKNGEEIDRIDMSKALLEWSENLFDVLEGDYGEGSANYRNRNLKPREAAGTGGTDGTDGTAGTTGTRLRQGSRLRQGCGGRDGGQADAAEKREGLVGIRYNDTSIIAWNLADSMNIRIGARKVSERAWHIDGYVADTLRISATVFGGKHATIRYVRFIRNGLTSRALRLKGLKAKLRAAAKAED